MARMPCFTVRLSPVIASLTCGADLCRSGRRDEECFAGCTCKSPLTAHLAYHAHERLESDDLVHGLGRRNRLAFCHCHVLHRWPELGDLHGGNVVLRGMTGSKVAQNQGLIG